MTSCLLSQTPIPFWKGFYSLTVLPPLKDPFRITHCRLNEVPHTLNWKSPISILGMSGSVMLENYIDYILDIPGEKWPDCLQTVKTLIRCHILWHLIWVCTVCQLLFWGSPDFNGLMLEIEKNSFPIWIESCTFSLSVQRKLQHSVCFYLIRKT